MESEWQERRNMVNFLYERGWMPSKAELIDAIDTYDLKREWESYKESLSTSNEGTELKFKVPSAKASDKPCPKCKKPMYQHQKSKMWCCDECREAIE